MPFSINIKNLGRLTDANIRIGNFTVFAGPNNTGKSFVSKALYSIFGALNANHVEAVFDGELATLRRNLLMIRREVVHRSSRNCTQSMMETVNKLYGIISDTVESERTKEIETIESLLPDIRESLTDIHAIFATLKKEVVAHLGTLKRENDGENDQLFEDTHTDMHAHRRGEHAENGVYRDESSRYRGYMAQKVQNIETCLAHLDVLSAKSGEELLKDGVRHHIRNNLIHNFQVPELLHLCNNNSPDTAIHFDSAEIGTMSIVKAGITHSIDTIGIDFIQQYSRVLYLESPMLMRLLPTWEKLDRTMRFSSRREQLIGIPQYAYDMAAALHAEYPGETIATDVVQKLTSDAVLGGKITSNALGELRFEEKGHRYPLHIAAMGVANLGVLAMLIERNVLDTDTFLFIDEPEAHLHTKWQVEIAEALFALSKKGVKVVIATHSAEIMKWLEVRVKEHPEDADGHIALNHFSVDGTVKSNGGRFEERIHAIQNELAHPFATLYYRG